MNITSRPGILPTSPAAAPAAPASPVAPVAQAATAPDASGATRPGRQPKDMLTGALKRALEVDPQARYAVDRSSNAATFLSGAFKVDVKPGASGSPIDAAATAFLRQHGQLFGISEPGSQLHLVQSGKDSLGMDHFRYQEYYNDLPVFGQQIVIHAHGDVIKSVGGHVTPNIQLSYDASALPKPADLLSGIATHVKGIAANVTSLKMSGAGTLGVFTSADGTPHLAYEMDVQSAQGPDRWRYYVDAQTGKVLDQWSTLESAMIRETFDAKNSQSRPGTIRRREGDGPTGDASVDAAHDGAASVYEYFMEKFGRDGIDGRGMKMVSTVHFGDRYNNAFWDGSQMTYGDGDGKLLGPLALGRDVVSHEMTHGITERSAGLQYRGQSGALNESWSDTFGNLVEHWDFARKNPGAAVKDPGWLVGEDVFTPGVDGDAIRSQSAPGTAYKDDPQPAHMKDYKNTSYDNGGVHINSGIPNLAAYKVHTAIGDEKLAQIWYRAQTQYLTPTSKFVDAANFTMQSAADLYGRNSAEVKAVIDAWTAVGVPPTASPSIG